MCHPYSTASVSLLHYTPHPDPSFPSLPFLYQLRLAYALANGSSFASYSASSATFAPAAPLNGTAAYQGYYAGAAAIGRASDPAVAALAATQARWRVKEAGGQGEAAARAPAARLDPSAPFRPPLRFTHAPFSSSAAAAASQARMLAALDPVASSGQANGTAALVSALGAALGALPGPISGAVLAAGPTAWQARGRRSVAIGSYPGSGSGSPNPSQLPDPVSLFLSLPSLSLPARRSPR